MNRFELSGENGFPGVQLTGRNTKAPIPVKIKRLHPDAEIPKYAKDLDAGFDLVATEDVIIEPGETKIIPTGLAIALPPGYEVQVRNRSGVASKTKLRVANSPGTVDAGYRGEIGVIIDNNEQWPTVMRGIDGNRLEMDELESRGLFRDFKAGYIVRKGDRIAQGIIAEAPQAVFEVVDELPPSVRGEGGFGHTGVKESE